MTRPIVWALGVATVAAVWGVSLASRFDRASPTADFVRSRTIESPAGPPKPQNPSNGPIASRIGSPNTMTMFADARGHFAIDATIDGQSLRMLVDTGATVCAFTYEDAQRAGLRVSERDFRHPIQTANGTVMAAQVRIGMLRVGTINIQAVEAMVMPRGRLGTSLLGMSFLRRLSEFSMANGRLTLRG